MEINFWLVGHVLIELEDGYYKAYCCHPACGDSVVSDDPDEINNWAVTHFNRGRVCNESEHDEL